MDREFATILLVLGFSGLFLLSWTPFGRALAERLRARSHGAGGDDVRALREELQGALQQLRLEMGELSERVDFAERLLAKQGEAARLAPPR